MAYNLGVNTGLTPPGSDEAVKDPSAPQPRPGFAGWWDALGSDKQSALQMAALTTGLSMMAQGPSRTPVTASETIGKAGLTGLNTYMTRDAANREMALKMAEFGLKNREVAAKEGELDVNKGKLDLEKSQWEPGVPPTTKVVPTGKYNPILGAPVETKYDLGGEQGSPYGLNMVNATGEPGKPVLPLGNQTAPVNYGGLGDAETRTVVTDPGKLGGLKAREAEATIKEKEAQAHKALQDRWDIKEGYVVDKSNGKLFKLNPNKKVEKVEGLGDRSVVFYDDGSREYLTHGLAPKDSLEYQEQLARAKAIGKLKGEGTTYTKIEGETFRKFMDHGWSVLTPQEQKVVSTRLEKSDPDMAQAAKLVNDDLKLINKPTEQKVAAQIGIYNQIKAQKGPDAWKNTADVPMTTDYRDRGVKLTAGKKGSPPSVESFLKGKKAAPSPLTSFDHDEED